MDRQQLRTAVADECCAEEALVEQMMRALGMDLAPLFAQLDPEPDRD
jgi:hypothetical protein